MSAGLEERYFIWLCAKITRPEQESQPYWALFRALHSYEFVWVVQGDANRAADAHDLRIEFRYAMGLTEDEFTSYHIDTGVSVLEVLIALARRAEFQTGESIIFWMHRFLENLDLWDCTYDPSGCNDDYVDSVLYSFVWRTYDYNGNGGLFPLVRAPGDQRKVELWYQFFEYIEAENIGR